MAARRFFHAAPRSLRERIAVEGLRVEGLSRGVWCYDEAALAASFPSRDGSSASVDVWAFTDEALNVRPMGDQRYLVYWAVPPERLTLLDPH